MKQSLSLLSGALLVLTPLAVMLPGCGGGSSGVVTPTATPTTPTATPPTSTPVGGTLQSSNFYLSNGQKGIFKFTTSGANISGTIEMLNTKVVFDGLKTRAFSGDITPGIYTFTGVQPKDFVNFLINVTRDGSRVFSMTAYLPKGDQPGGFTINRVQGAYEQDAGPLLPIGQDFPAKAPKPTPTALPVHPVFALLNLKASSDSNFKGEQPYYASLVPSGSKRNIKLGFSTVGSTKVSGALQMATIGKIYTPNSADIATLPSIESTVSGETRRFTFQGGSIEVTRLTKEYGQLTFKDAIFAPSVDGTAGGATGTITVNGTLGGVINSDSLSD